MPGFERRFRTPWKEILRRFVMKRDFGTQSPRGLDSRAESSDRRLHRSRERGEEPFPFVEPHPQHYCFDQFMKHYGQLPSSPEGFEAGGRRSQLRP